MARSRNSYSYAAFNALTGYSCGMSGQNFAPRLRQNREGQSIMHPGDFVGNGRAAGIAPKAGWLKPWQP
jgi:hypothetical protein